MKEKIKILIVPSDTMGVGHFRSIWPAQSLEKYHGDKFEVEINATPRVDNIDYMSQFDIIHFHRHLGDYENSSTVWPKLREAGCTLIMDIDDYWKPPVSHPMYEMIEKDGLSDKILNNVRLADYVTTTTEIFADHIKRENPNVHVIPNALDMSHKMWRGKLHENKTDKCRIAWIGGSSHLKDLEILAAPMKKLHSSEDLKDKFQIVMCGFDTRGSITEIAQNGERRTRQIHKQETVWRQFESILTGGLVGVEDDVEYKKWLDKIKREDYPGMYESNYLRRWTLPLTQYGKHYDYCDVCLAPLEQIEQVYRKNSKNPNSKGTMIKQVNYFNEVKSELKIIEAGMKKKALIAQDFGIYSKILKDGETGILIKNNKKDWYKAMYKVIEDKDYREMLANNLHEYVMARYELKHVTDQRAEWYTQLMKEKAETKKEKQTA
jgi:glycosyltransferase involved in cell wall biosynthesis